MGILRVSRIDVLKRMTQRRLSNKLLRALSTAIQDASLIVTLNWKIFSLTKRITSKSSTMASLHVSRMIRGSRYSVERHHTWHLKSCKRQSIVDHQLIFGRLEFLCLLFSLGSFHTEAQLMKSSTQRSIRLIIALTRRSKTL